MNRRVKKRRTGYTVAKVLAVVIILAFGVPLLLGRLFPVRTINVQGNSYVTGEQVIEASGVQLGENLLLLSAGRIQQGINAHRYLEYASIWKDYFAGTLTLTVKEHAPLAKMVWMGMLVLVGDDGVVLEQTSALGSPVHIPEIVGMTVSKVRVGYPVEYSVAGQGEAITRILDDLAVQGIAGEVLEINITSPDNLFLVMENGLQVMLGDDRNLPQKFALIRDMMPRVQAYEAGTVQGGILDVSTGRVADYRSPGA